MGYSVELRQRVIQYVRAGGSKAEAARRFQVSRGRVYAWLSLPEDQLAPAKPGPKSARKVDMAALAAAIEAHPDRLQTELATEFGARPSTMHYARRCLGITRKKTVALRGKRPTETPPIPTAQRTLPSPRENLALPG